MSHARHVFRVALVVVAVLAVTLIARGSLVPESYGRHGAYRHDNVAEQMSVRTPAFRGPAACGECHGEQLELRAAGSHKTVSCEVCHGPLIKHVKDDGSVEPPSVDRSYTLCARCHRTVDGRPRAFPQVNIEEHVNGPVEGPICLTCHDPHSPKL